MPFVIAVVRVVEVRLYVEHLQGTPSKYSFMVLLHGTRREVASS
jgi:hypothetical protein